MGRTTAFNATLFLTALFGVFASFAPTFIWLCISLFFLGSAVGVSPSLPHCVIGTNNVMHRRGQCLLMALSSWSTCQTGNSIS